MTTSVNALKPSHQKESRSESMIGILGAAKYESILEGDAERSTVSARYGDVSVLMGEPKVSACASHGAEIRLLLADI